MAAIYRSLLAACAFASVAVAQPSTTRACNNSPKLCSRAYNKVTYLGAHDSAFVRNASNGYTVAGNQFFTTPVQLDAGVRLVTSQIHKAGNNSLHLCHTYCQLYDAGYVSGWLTSIRSWLDDNPNEVVTILLVNGDNVPAATIDAEFAKAQIRHYAYVPSSTSTPAHTWPTLNQLINRNKRLIVFIQPLVSPVSTAAYLLDQFTFTFENNYDNSSPSDFSCTANRPPSLAGKTAEAVSSGRLPVLNHFLYDKVGSDIEIPAVEKANMTNSPGNAGGDLGLAATTCAKTYGKNPNYLLVDFMNVGPAIKSVDKLNALSAADIKGRRPLPNMVYSAGPGPSQTAPLSHSHAQAAATGRPAVGTQSAALAPKVSDGAAGTNAAPGGRSLLSSIMGLPVVAAIGNALGQV